MDAEKLTVAECRERALSAMEAADDAFVEHQNPEAQKLRDVAQFWATLALSARACGMAHDRGQPWPEAPKCVTLVSEDSMEQDIDQLSDAKLRPLLAMALNTFEARHGRVVLSNELQSWGLSPGSKRDMLTVRVENPQPDLEPLNNATLARLRDQVRAILAERHRTSLEQAAARQPRDTTP